MVIKIVWVVILQDYPSTPLTWYTMIAPGINYVITAMCTDKAHTNWHLSGDQQRHNWHRLLNENHIKWCEVNSTDHRCEQLLQQVSKPGCNNLVDKLIEYQANILKLVSLRQFVCDLLHQLAVTEIANNVYEVNDKLSIR